MKLRDLITHLQSLDPDLEATAFNGEFEYVIDVENIKIRKMSGWPPHELYDDSNGNDYLSFNN